MKFEYKEFATVARGAFYKVFEHFMDAADTMPSPELECAMGMAALDFICKMKNRIFDEDQECRQDFTVDVFDSLVNEIAQETTEGLDMMVRVGFLLFLAEITKGIKIYYHLVNKEEE